MSDDHTVNRRHALKVLGTCAVTAGVTPEALLALDHHPAVPHVQGVPWTPRVFSGREDALVTVLADLIIPATDTPGAKAAKVNQYIDFVLSEEVEEVRTEFRERLAWIDARSRDRFGREFLGLEETEQIDLLTPLAAGADQRAANPEPPLWMRPPDAANREPDTGDAMGIEFFAELKRLTGEGYYRSEIGMRQEVGYDGNRVLRAFEGCTHPEHE